MSGVYNILGIASNIKLLLKLIQDHSEASTKENDDRKVQRVAGMIKIIDDAKSRIEKCKSSGKKELRRCNTDLRPNAPRVNKKSNEPITDEKERLRKELNASLAARKSLEIMCSSLGKEKEIMASELSKKVQELCGMEELISDLKAQNEMLLRKVQTCVEEHIEKKCNRGEVAQGNAGLHERNRALSEQLLKSLDGYRSLKRKFKEAKEENIGILATMEEMGMGVQAGLDRVRSFRQQMASRNEKEVDIEEISALENMFESFNIKISKHGHKKSTHRVKTQI